MSEVSLFNQMEQKAKEECQAVIAESERQAKAILDAAKREAEREAQKRADKAEKARQARLNLAKRKAQAARLNAERVTRLMASTESGELKGTAIAKSKAVVFGDLDKWIEKPLYEDALKEMLQEAVQSIGQDPTLPLRIRVTSKDKRRMQGLLKKQNVLYEMDIDDSLLGGIVVTSQDGTLVADARLQTRLQRVWEDSLSDVCRILFEERSDEKDEDEQKEDKNKKEEKDEKGKETDKETAQPSPEEESGGTDNSLE